MVYDGVLRNECWCWISILFVRNDVLMYDNKGLFILEDCYKLVIKQIIICYIVWDFLGILGFIFEVNCCKVFNMNQLEDVLFGQFGNLVLY